jgi:hypothetical protein
MNCRIVVLSRYHTKTGVRTAPFLCQPQQVLAASAKSVLPTLGSGLFAADTTLDLDAHGHRAAQARGRFFSCILGHAAHLGKLVVHDGGTSSSGPAHGLGDVSGRHDDDGFAR